MRKFSFEEYKTIINSIRTYIPIIKFDQVTELTSKYCVIRHDVEYSIDRALSLAYIENELGVSSTYVIQVCNNNYNPFSNKNITKISKIIELGHDFGVHVHLGNFNETFESIESYIIKQIHLLSIAFNLPINKFSFHRPLKKYIETPIIIPGYINMNDNRYFIYTENFDIYNLPILYLADSNHTWKYGYPLDIDFSKISKMQLNCHPFSWTEKGLENSENFYILTKEKQLEALESINEEIKTYPKDLYEKERNLVASH